MNQLQSDIKALKALLIAAEGGNPGEDVSALLDRAPLAFLRVRDEVHEKNRRHRAARAPYAGTEEERELMGQPRHIGRGCMDEVMQ